MNPMIITRVRLTNWKNFKSVDVVLQPRVFVVGANASGKSNFLDVFRFLRDIAKPLGGGLQQAINLRGGMPKMRSLAARNRPMIQIDVEMGEQGAAQPTYRYSIELILENKGKRRTLLKSEKVWHNGEVIIDRPNSDDKKDDERLTRTFLENPTTNSTFRPIAELFAGVSYLHLVPQLLRSVKSTDIEQSGEDYYGKNFLVRVSNTHDRVKKVRLRRIGEALAKILPQFDELDDDKDSAGVPHLRLKLKHWRPGAGWQHEDQFSDGTIRMLGLFWSMLESDSILLFEEPELSLNDSIVKVLPSQLWKLQASKGRQVILTTHSYALLSDDGISPKEVLILESAKEGTNIVSADSNSVVKQLTKGGMSVGEAVLPRTTSEDLGQLLL